MLKKWNRRLLAMLLMLLMTVSVLAGCTSKPAAPAQTTAAQTTMAATAAPAPTAAVAAAETTAAPKPSQTAALTENKKETKAAETTAAPAETKAPETKAQETQAPKETKAPETTAAAKETKPANETQAAAIDKDGSYSTKEEVALYLHTYGKLPSNYLTKKEAENLGWNASKGNLWDVAPGMSIGGSNFGNYEKLLPDQKGRKYYECDIDYKGKKRNAKRIVYSNDGLIFYTEDHYKTFEQLY